MKFENLIGRQFGRLKVIELLPRVKTPKGVSQVKYLCRCECGNEIEVFAGNLRKGNTKSCGCLNLKEISKRQLIDLSGKRFGFLTVLNRAEDKVSESGNASAMWNCICDCGSITIVNGNSLRRGKQLSCGCLRRKVSSEKKRIDLSGKQFGKLTVLSSFVDNSLSRPIIKWKCKCECGSVTCVTTTRLTSGWTKSCGCMLSSLEEKVSSILSSRHISFETQYTFPNLIGPNGGKLRFDYALFKDGQLLALLEVQGKQHFKEVGDIEFGRYQRECTDSIKKEYCDTNNIQLLEIAYNEDIEASTNNFINMLYGNPVPSFGNEEGVTTNAQ